MKFNVFSDTLVITEGDPRIMKTKLMFPPIPIEHLSITMTDVAGTLNREHINYEILISPFVKLLLKSEEHNQKETAYLMKNLELMIQQLPFKDTKKTSKLQYFFTNKPERHRKKTNLSLNFISPSDENQMDVDSFMKVNTSLDKNIYYSLTDNYILKKNELNYTDVKNLFNSDCIMYQFKHQNQNFEKCIANQISIHSKGHQSWVKLILSQTGHEMVTFRIDGTIKYRSSTRANADGKTLEMVFHQNNVQKTQIFALKFPNEQVYNEITMVLGKCVTMSISANYIEFKDHLILQPKPNWNHFDIDINQSSLNTLDYLQTKEVTFHRMCLLKPMNSKNYVQLGPVDSYLVLSGPPGQIFSTRLVLRSTINPTLTYLNVELFPNDWFIKEQPDNIVMLRIFDRFLKTFTDYYLTMNDNLMYQEKFIEILEKESKECLKRQELQTQKKFLRNESEETKVLQLGDDEVHLNSIEAQISKLGLRPHHKKAGQSSSSLEKRKVSASFDKTICQVKHLKLSRVF
ncbi:hypothetical protein BC833DRAFT_323756 [Globomyces pollinis-pini]|nr:hypothetical protein BC833DRAFT_323756 [Globomyces pollinis-pini]